MPYFIAQFGFWLSPVGFVLIGLVTCTHSFCKASPTDPLIAAYTLSNMFSLGKKFRCDTYPEICERAWGTKGSLIASTFIFVYNWCAALSCTHALYVLTHACRGNNVAGNLIVASSLPSMLRAFFCMSSRTDTHTHNMSSADSSGADWRAHRYRHILHP